MSITEKLWEEVAERKPKLAFPCDQVGEYFNYRAIQ